MIWTANYTKPQQRCFLTLKSFQNVKVAFCLYPSYVNSRKANFNDLQNLGISESVLIRPSSQTIWEIDL